MKVYFSLVLLVFMVCLSCKNNSKKQEVTDPNNTVEQSKMENPINSKPFDTSIEGMQIKLYWLENKMADVLLVFGCQIKIVV